MDGKKKITGGLTPCGARVRAADPARFLLGLFAPTGARPALWALYAFDLEIAEIPAKVTEKTMGLIRLQWWRDAIARIYETGACARHEILEALCEAIQSHDLDQRDFEAWLDARERDLDDTPFETLEALEAHVLAVTRPWVAMTLKCTGDEPGDPSMNRICIAWGLVGMMRALSSDIRRGRCTLPGFSMNRSDPKMNRVEPEMIRSLHAVVERVEDCLAGIRPSAPVLCAMAGLSRQYPGQIRSLKYNILSPRMILPPAFSALRLWFFVVFRKII